MVAHLSLHQTDVCGVYICLYIQLVPQCLIKYFIMHSRNYCLLGISTMHVVGLAWLQCCTCCMSTMYECHQPVKATYINLTVDTTLT